jgi:predicted LPLAT superfamily acyltransferase
LIFFLLAGPQRRAVLHNLQALNPRMDAWSLFFGGVEVFHQFALVYLDRLYHMHFRLPVEWDLPDIRLLEEMREEPGGLIIFTAHSGNYDIGASLFASKFGRPVHIVRVPERTPEMQSLREKELQRAEAAVEHLRVHYNSTADAHLGLALCRLLNAGEVVAVQGDRVMLEVSGMSAEHEGVSFYVPRGPLVLAEVTRCPCYPIFLTRSSFLRYRIHVGPAFTQRGEHVPTQELIRRWLGVLHPFLVNHTAEWSVFEPMLNRPNHDCSQTQRAGRAPGCVGRGGGRFRGVDVVGCHWLGSHAVYSGVGRVFAWHHQARVRVVWSGSHSPG